MGAQRKYHLIESEKRDEDRNEERQEEVIGAAEESESPKNKKTKKAKKGGGPKKGSGKFILWFVVAMILLIVVAIALSFVFAPIKDGSVKNQAAASSQQSSQQQRNVGSLYAVIQDGATKTAVSSAQNSSIGAGQRTQSLTKPKTMYAAAQAMNQTRQQPSDDKNVLDKIATTTSSGVQISQPQKPKRPKPKMVCKVLKNDNILYSVLLNGKMVDCYAISGWDGNGIDVRKGQTLKSYDTRVYDGITYFRYKNTNKYINSLADSLKCERIAQ